MIKKSGAEGLNILGKHIIITQFADDTTLFLRKPRKKKRKPNYYRLMSRLNNQFSKASGFMLNINKCEILALHKQPACSISNISVKTEVKYLGITVAQNKEIREKVKILRNLEKCKKMLNLWLHRDITIFGRVLLTKTESISRAIHPAYSLGISDNMIDLLNKTNLNFIWKENAITLKKLS